MAARNRIKRDPSRSVDATPSVQELSSILHCFNDALSVAETAAQALEAAEIRGIGAAQYTLGRSMNLLRDVYSKLDLVVGRLSRALS